MSIQFDNVPCFPLGDATLNIVNNQLVVSNIGTSGLDGIMMKIPVGCDYVIAHDRFEFNNDGNLKISTLSKTDDGLLFTEAEKCIWHNSSEQKIFYGYNFAMVPGQYSIIGYKNGSPVFSNPHDNPTSEPGPTFWHIVGAVAACVGAAAAVIALLTETTTVTIEEFYPNGVLKRRYSKTTEDPQAIDVEVDGQTYNVDTWGIEYSHDFAEADNAKPPKTIGVQILASDINEIKINQIQTPNITVIS